MSSPVELGERVTSCDRKHAGEVITRCDKGAAGVRVRCDDGGIRFMLRFERSGRL